MPRAGTATRNSRARRWTGLAAMGLYGVAIPEEWGGAGLGYGALAVACEEIAAGDCATSTIVVGEQPRWRASSPATATTRRKSNS